MELSLWICIFFLLTIALHSGIRISYDVKNASETADIMIYFLLVELLHTEMILSILNIMEILSAIASKYILMFQFPFSPPFSLGTCWE